MQPQTTILLQFLFHFNNCTILLYIIFFIGTTIFACMSMVFNSNMSIGLGADLVHTDHLPCVNIANTNGTILYIYFRGNNHTITCNSPSGCGPSVYADGKYSLLMFE